MTSALHVDTIAAKNGTDPVELTKQAAAKVIFRYNQATNSLESGDLNVSSVSDDSTGLFTVSFTSAMNDTLYAPTGFSGEEGNTNNAQFLSKKSSQSDFSTTALPLISWNYAGSSTDAERNACAIFGDLA